MDYLGEVKKIDEFVTRELYREAAANCGRILEALLSDIYEKIMRKAPVADKKRLLEIEEEIGGGKGSQNFTLGQLNGLYRKGRIFDMLKPVLSIQLKHSSKIPLDMLVTIRNSGSHPNLPAPTLQELQVFVANLRLFLCDLGYVDDEDVGVLTPLPSKPHRWLSMELLTASVCIIVIAASLLVWMQNKQKGPFLIYYVLALVILTSTVWALLANTMGRRNQSQYIIALFAMIGVGVSLALVWRYVTVETLAPMAYEPFYLPYLILLGGFFIVMLLLIFRYTVDSDQDSNRIRILVSLVVLAIYLLICRIVWQIVDKPLWIDWIKNKLG